MLIAGPPFHIMDTWNLLGNLNIHPSAQQLTYAMMGSCRIHMEMQYLICNKDSLNFCWLDPTHTPKGICFTHIILSHHSSCISVGWVTSVKTPTGHHRVTICPNHPHPEFNSFQPDHWRTIASLGDSNHTCTSHATGEVINPDNRDLDMLSFCPLPRIIGSFLFFWIVRTMKEK